MYTSLVCGSSDFFQSRFNVKNTRVSSFHHCFTILRSRKCGIIYTRFHAFHVHINVELFSHVFVHLYVDGKQVC